jgi:hypothetical protein
MHISPGSSPSPHNTNKHLLTLRLRGGDAFRVWLGRMLVDNPNGLGSELVESTTGPDNVSACDDVLRAAEALGWIERTAFAPSVSRRAFGGLQYSGGIDRASDDAKKHHASWFMWRVVDREAVEAFVGDKKPAPGSFALGDLVRYDPAFVRQCGDVAEMRRATGTVVGFSELRTNAGVPFPRVKWSDDPEKEPECASPYFEGGCSRLNVRTNRCPDHPLVPYAARAISPAGVRRA